MDLGPLFERPQPPHPPATVRPVEGVSNVVNYIRKVISQNRTLANLRVRGEISGLAEKNGRLYFDLKENADILKCIVWANAVAKLPTLQNGNEAIVEGDFGIWSQRSQYQLSVTAVELTGIGALYAQFEALKKRFREEGLFEASRKRPMPAYVTRVALVSARGKGAEDFLTTLQRRAPSIGVDFVETRVQGDGAAIDIAEAVDRASRLPVDVIVLARGGGSYEDLFAFNVEPVVRAIVRARHPVLSAIGHTGDVHLSDLVADRVCETPSNAAQYFGELCDGLRDRVRHAQQQLERATQALVYARTQRVDAAENALVPAVKNVVHTALQRMRKLEHTLDRLTPQQRVGGRALRLTDLRARLDLLRGRVLEPKRVRLGRALTALAGERSLALRAKRERLNVLNATLCGADPNAPLERGYAIVTRNGKPLTDAGLVAPGDAIEARLRRGTLLARVERSSSDG